MSLDWKRFENKTVFITGATGLIGTALIDAFFGKYKDDGLKVKLIALVRDEEKARERFSYIKDEQFISYIVGKVEDYCDTEYDIDYIIHGASKTASKDFTEHSVETIETSVLGTERILRLAKEKRISGMVYMSSMEVYGHPPKGHKVTEDEIGAMTPLDLRNSYPISKVMAEAMCCAYASEYDVPVKICRLTQTYGTKVHDSDNRVFAYFNKCVEEKKNIILKTKGETERSYLTTEDAVTAILTILLNGENGKAYNAADESTYCSIADMAKKIAKEGGIEVEFDIEDERANGFPQTLYMDLDTTALRDLGWKPQGDKR